MESIIETLEDIRNYRTKELEQVKRDIVRERGYIEAAQARIGELEIKLTKFQDFVDDYDRAIQALRSVL